MQLNDFYWTVSIRPNHLDGGHLAYCICILLKSKLGDNLMVFLSGKTLLNYIKLYTLTKILYFPFIIFEGGLCTISYVNI
jgi:hypothetical protein